MTTMLGLRLLAKRRPALLASAVRLASTEAKAPLILKSLSDDGILTLRFNLEKKVRPVLRTTFAQTHNVFCPGRGLFSVRLLTVRLSSLSRVVAKCLDDAADDAALQRHD